jgi:ParB family chromosome partitioning protein
VPCIVKEVPEENVLELSLIENIQREELNPIEEASAYRKLLEKPDLTQEELGRRVGKDRSSIANALRLLKLPIEVQKLVEENKLSAGHARSLLSLDSGDQQVMLAREITTRALSVRETEQLVKKRHRGLDHREPTLTTRNAESANILAAQSRLSKKLGAPVKIKLAKTGGTVEIKFSSTEDLARLFDVLIQMQPTPSA